MKRAGNGSIINTASFVGFLGAATPQVLYSIGNGKMMPFLGAATIVKHLFGCANSVSIFFSFLHILLYSNFFFLSFFICVSSLIQQVKEPFWHSHEN